MLDETALGAAETALVPMGPEPLQAEPREQRSPAEVQQQLAEESKKRSEPPSLALVYPLTERPSPLEA